MNEITHDEMQMLLDRHFKADNYSFTNDYEHRVDPESSAITYSLIRELKPQSVLEIGTWEGGTTCIIMTALIKNNLSYKFVASELLNDKKENTRNHVMQKCGKVPKLIGDITRNLDKVPKTLDFLFLDSDHDTKTTNWIVKHIFPRIKKGGLFITHDWAVREAEDGSWFGKADKGAGGWPETQVFLDMQKAGKFPFKKLYWNYLNPNQWELGCFIKI